MRNLARLTTAAQPRSTFDRRKAPRCAEPGCWKRCEHLGNGNFINHCYDHASPEERQRYRAAWVKEE